MGNAENNEWRVLREVSGVWSALVSAGYYSCHMPGSRHSLQDAVKGTLGL